MLSQSSPISKSYKSAGLDTTKLSENALVSIPSAALESTVSSYLYVNNDCSWQLWHKLFN